MSITKSSETLVLVSKQNGVVIIPSATPLTRLNYFDGKFLRASDLKAEQDYLRQLVRQSNQAGGPGVAHGFDVTLGVGDTLNIGPGLAIDPDGRVLLLPQETTLDIQELIDKSRDLINLFGNRSVRATGSFDTCDLAAETPPDNTPRPSDLYLITISHAEALCGEEDVFGKLCEEACATSTDRPFLVEGLIVRAIPLVLRTPLPNSKAVPLTRVHLRSRVASAYFEDERQLVASLISKSGLELETWCLGADAASGSGVPIGVISRAGSATVFLDAWISRRERIDTPARRYWQWRMMMRPWDVFLAQILQFQCQLHDLFRKTPIPGGETDPCAGARGVISEAAQAIAELRRFYEAASEQFTNRRDAESLSEDLIFSGGVTRLADLKNKLTLVEQTLAAPTQNRLLIAGGIIELPSAGYLPVVPSASLTINQQVRLMMGEGVDLRFCVVRPDYVAHALEEAQHMERISLIEGLDDPKKKPQVDILVPDGEIVEQKQLSPGRGFEANVSLAGSLVPGGTTGISTGQSPVIFRGAARSETLPSGGGAVFLSSAPESFTRGSLVEDAGDIRNASIFSGFAAPAEATGGAPAQPAAATESSLLVGAGIRSSALAGIIKPDKALWVGLRCERNIFTLQRRDTTNVNARAILVANRTVGGTNTASPSILDIELNGLFEITAEASLTSSATVVKGRFTDAQFSLLTPSVNQTPKRNSTFVNLDVTVTLTKRSQIEIVLEHAQNIITLSANWGNNPLEVSAKISTTSKDGKVQRQFLETLLKENEDVLSATNPNHVLALQALDVIASALGDLNFAEAKARLLFPPPPKPSDELIVRGTKDWVLFHRRRTKQCSEEKVAPPPPPSRRYQVFEVLAENADDAERLKKILLAGQIPGGRLVNVAVIEYGGGTATLVTRAEDIQKDWQNANAGNTIIYGAIANRDSAAADGETLSRTRLDHLEDALAPISKLSPQAQDDFLTSVPASLPASGVDGVIVLITLNQVEKTCNLVFRVNAGQMNEVLNAVKAGEVKTAVENFSQLVGEGSFNAGTGDVADDSLQPVAQKWQQMGGGTLAQVTVTTFAQDQTVPEALALAQATTIEKALSPAGAGVPTPKFVASSKPFPPSITCPVITFVAPQIERAALVVFSVFNANSPGAHIPAQGSTQTKVTFISNVPQGTALLDSFKGLPPGTGLGRVVGVTLADVVAPLDADAQLRLTAVVNALRSAAGPGTPRTNLVVLTQPDKDQLASHGVSIAGIDEVIYLELFS